MSTVTSAPGSAVTVTKTVASSSAAATGAPDQASIFSGGDPIEYNPQNPIILFIVQACIIIIFCRILSIGLRRIRQPRVIAEVVGGILLGHSVMGRIPGFTDNIFPKAGMAVLSNVANLGLLLFLFLVGLEVDLRYLVSNWKVTLSVGVASMALPFGLGCAVAWGLYNQFKDEPGTKPVVFGTYMLFIGVAMAITAFPVLCRILTELKLLGTNVGVIVLSAGVSNDIVGWVLLALCVALVNANSGLVSLWVLLTGLGWTLFVVFLVRPAFLWVLRRTRAIQDGPSQSIMALTLLMVLTSAFYTGVIGIHPIFGAFLIGVICPHEGGFAIKVTEKIEDLVATLFLPLYFALSGLNTDLGLLDSGIIWGYVVAIIAIAFFAKFGGAAIAARANGLLWRECFTIGSLMSCKGLVELIVLNIGLQAKILSKRTFTMFVVMALVTTFATTPLTMAFYPPWYQRKVAAWRRGEIDWDSGKAIGASQDTPRDSLSYDKLESKKIQKMLIYLRLDNMPALMAFLSLFGGQPAERPATVHPTGSRSASTASGMDKRATIRETEAKTKPVMAHGVRLMELTDRSSSVMKVTEMEEYSQHDPLVNTFRAFGHMHALGVSGEVFVTPESGYAEALASKAAEMRSDMLLLPWTETGSMSETLDITEHRSKFKLHTPSYAALVQDALRNARCTVGVFVSNGFGGVKASRRPPMSRAYSATSIRSKQGIADAREMTLVDRSHHIFFPFFGGADDRAALRLVIQLASSSPDVTATAVFYQTAEGYFGPEKTSAVDASTHASPNDARAPATPLAAESAPPSSGHDADLFLSLRSTLPAHVATRVVLEVEKSSAPATDALLRAEQEVGQRPNNAGDLVVLGRSADKTASFAHEMWMEKQQQTADEIEATGSTRGPLGVVAEKVIGRGMGASVLVIQAKREKVGDE